VDLRDLWPPAQRADRRRHALPDAPRRRGGGKALGLPRDLTELLTGLVWGWSMDGISEEQIGGLIL